MITIFTCDRKAAAKVAGFTGIDRTGKYVGIITQAEVADTPSGATYVELAFKASSWVEKTGDVIGAEEKGEKLAFIRIYVAGRDGRRTFGADIIDALLVVLGIEKAQAVETTVYNMDGSKRQGYRINAIESDNRNPVPVGLLLQRENREYQDRQGEWRLTYQMNIVTPYDPITGRCAKEILSNSDTATIVDSKLKTLKDKEPKANAIQKPAPATTASPETILEDNPF